MNLRDYFKERLDVNRSGKVDFEDALFAVEERFGAERVKGFAVGFIAAAVIVAGLFAAYRFL